MSGSDDVNVTEAGGSAAVVKTSKLNPCAPVWKPEDYDENEDIRSLFVTFSNGYPLNEAQISNFFTKKYGACVERVYVHRGRPSPSEKRSKPPLFGKVTFKWAFMVKRIMSGEAKVCFRIDGRPLWCKSFDPSRLPSSRAASSSSTATATPTGEEPDAAKSADE